MSMTSRGCRVVVLNFGCARRAARQDKRWHPQGSDQQQARLRSASWSTSHSSRSAAYPPDASCAAEFHLLPSALDRGPGGACSRDTRPSSAFRTVCVQHDQQERLIPLALSLCLGDTGWQVRVVVLFQRELLSCVCTSARAFAARLYVRRV